MLSTIANIILTAAAAIIFLFLIAPSLLALMMAITAIIDDLVNTLRHTFSRKKPPQN